MCGILGSINHHIDNRVLDTIKHRGPDDFGMQKILLNGHDVQLCHRRLSIIDLSPAGHQPMNTTCGQYAIIFNGEIYNHQDLKDKLPADITFRGHSDTETMLYYLKTFGIEGVKDFNGIFSFAFVDYAKQVVYLARDPFGVKPLYYHLGNNTMTFSSEMRPIKKQLANNGSINKEAMATLLRLRYNPSPETIYADIQKVKPGHYLAADLSGAQLHIAHTCFIHQLPATLKSSEAELKEAYGRKLVEAINRQLLADVEIGVLLSGGIDSAVVAALAKRHTQGKMKAFTIGFEGNHAEDEIEDAAETAELLQLDHHYKKITFTDFLNTIKECARIVEEPLATTSIIPMYFLSELASKHVKVVITGQGADEPLGGYTRYRSELIYKKIPMGLQQMLQPIAKLASFKSEKISRGINALGVKDEIARFLNAYEIFNEYEITCLIGVKDKISYQRIQYFYDVLGCKNKTNAAEKMMALDARMNLADDLLNYTDKISMHFSLECRVPMLDLELVSFIESLPPSMKLNLSSGKLIHKEFASALLPDKIINRKKKAFQSPTRTWFKTEVDTVKQILLANGTNFSRLFNQRYVAELIEKHQNGYNMEKQIFLLLSIYFVVDHV